MYEAVYDAFHRPSTELYRRVSTAVWILIVFSIVLLAVDLSVPLDFVGRPVLDVLDKLILLIFVVELVLRVGTYRPRELDFYDYGAVGSTRTHVLGRLRFCLTPMVMIDILTVLGTVPVLRGLRALRLLRLLRTNRILRYANPFEGIARAFEENRLLYIFGLTVFAFAVTLGGLSFYMTERLENPDIHNIPDGMWWAIVTITTVGYGDITPVTGVGKIVAAAMMVVGMITIALFAGIVGSTLMRSVLSMREESFRMSNYLDHVVICGYEPGAAMLLSAIAAEIDLDRFPIVIFAPGERPPEVPAEFRWVMGDPTKESELEKVRMRYANAAIIVGSRAELPQLADARTILIAFTIRRFLKQSPAEGARQKDVYLVAEILDAENVPHAKTAGADEVIETRRMGFSMIAHSVKVHGTATLLGELADPSQNSLFVGNLPDDLDTPHDFGSVRRQLKQRFNILMIGVRDPGGIDRLNPEDDVEMTSLHKVIYIAHKSVLPE